MYARWRALLAGAAVIFSTSVAAAQARVSVGPFTGQHADMAAQIVASALSEHSGEIEYVTDSAYSAAASRLGIAQSGVNEQDVARVAREMRLDAVIVGELQRRGRREYLLRVRVLRGRDGSVLGTTSWELRSMDELESIQPEIWPQLHNYISRDTGAPEQLPPTEISPSSSPPPTNETPTSVSRTPGLALAYVSIAGGIGMRSWRMPVLGELSPRGYENGGFAEGAAEASIFYRFANQRAGIGASGGVVFPISLASRGYDTMGMVVSLPTSTLEGWGGVAFAYRPPGGGLFRSDIGIVAHSFGIDTSALPLEQQLAPVSYTGARIAAEGIAPLYASNSFELGAVFATQLRITAIGSAVRAAFGENPGTTVGIGGLAGLQVRLDGLVRGLALRLTGEFMRYRTSFFGRADIGTGSDSVDDYGRIHCGITYGILTAP
jgi:hypothetical protein